MVSKKVSEPSVEDLISSPIVPSPVPAPTPAPPARQSYGGRVMVNRPAFRKPYRPMNRRPYPQQNFTGVVDNRVIPDADLPTEEVTGMLELSGDQHGVLRADFSPGGKDIYIFDSRVRRSSHGRYNTKQYAYPFP